MHTLTETLLLSAQSEQRSLQLFQKSNGLTENLTLSLRRGHIDIQVF